MTTCGVHTFGVWDRAFAAARAWGFFKPVPERPRALGLPHRREVGRDVGPPVPLRQAAVGGREVQALRPHADGDGQRPGPDRRPAGLPIQRENAVHAPAAARLLIAPFGSSFELDEP